MTKVITLSELAANIRWRRSGKTLLIAFINQCKDSDAVIIPPNATNGDLLMALFPQWNLREEIGFEYKLFGEEHKFEGLVDEDWWNAPYKGSEG